MSNPIMTVRYIVCELTQGMPGECIAKFKYGIDARTFAKTVNDEANQTVVVVLDPRQLMSYWEEIKHG
jgi:hypothetical protein